MGNETFSPLLCSTFISSLVDKLTAWGVPAFCGRRAECNRQDPNVYVTKVKVAECQANNKPVDCLESFQIPENMNNCCKMNGNSGTSAPQNIFSSLCCDTYMKASHAPSSVPSWIMFCEFMKNDEQAWSSTLPFQKSRNTTCDSFHGKGGWVKPPPVKPAHDQAVKPPMNEGSPCVRPPHEAPTVC